MTYSKFAIWDCIVHVQMEANIWLMFLYLSKVPLSSTQHKDSVDGITIELFREYINIGYLTSQ